jgi:acetyl esterase/lipase
LGRVCRDRGLPDIDGKRIGVCLLQQAVELMPQGQLMGQSAGGWCIAALANHCARSSDLPPPRVLLSLYGMTGVHTGPFNTYRPKDKIGGMQGRASSEELDCGSPCRFWHVEAEYLADLFERKPEIPELVPPYSDDVPKDQQRQLLDQHL